MNLFTKLVLFIVVSMAFISLVLNYTDRLNTVLSPSRLDFSFVDSESDANKPPSAAAAESSNVVESKKEEKKEEEKKEEVKKEEGKKDEEKKEEAKSEVKEDKGEERNLNAYKRLHADLVSGKVAPLKVSLNLSPDQGYGNRLFSLLSSFVVALITDSAFVVSRWDTIAPYVDGPLGEDTFRHYSTSPNDSSLLNPDFDLKNTSTTFALDVEKYFNVFGDKNIKHFIDSYQIVF